jgi:uncharacterized protein (TIGR00661 family)
MNILYGVQATGNGHISRSREIIAALKKAGHSVGVILSGRDPAQLWDMDIFQPYTVYKGMTLEFERGKMCYLKTARSLAIRQLYRDVRAYRSPCAFDVALIDFEPVTARIARRLRIPSIGIGHQYAFNYNVPVAKRDPIARWILRCFAPADQSIGLHWHHFGHPILPPVVPSISSGAVQDNKILVYLPFEEQSDVLRLLQPFSTYDFYYYTAVSEPRDEGTVHLRPFSRTGFIDDLRTCSGVICNAGFELASEALHIGKKLLVKPLAGQLEQTSNALALQVLKLGDAMNTLSPDAVQNWLERDAPAPQAYPDVAQLIADWIAHGDWKDTARLVARAWGHVEGDMKLTHQKPACERGASVVASGSVLMHKELSDG